jgi:hypothetical protein
MLMRARPQRCASGFFICYNFRSLVPEALILRCLKSGLCSRTSEVAIFGVTATIAGAVLY